MIVARSADVSGVVAGTAGVPISIIATLQVGCGDCYAASATPQSAASAMTRRCCAGPLIIWREPDVVPGADAGGGGDRGSRGGWFRPRVVAADPPGTTGRRDQ